VPAVINDNGALSFGSYETMHLCVNAPECGSSNLMKPMLKFPI